MFADFYLFGYSHILALTAISLIGFFLVLLLRRSQSPAIKRKILYMITGLCFAAFPLSVIATKALGGTLTLSNSLPLHLCDLVVVLCGFALLTQRPLLCELAYFWGLTGAFQGLITPDINRDFPDPLFFTFFLQHGLIIVSALILPFALRWKPSPGAARRAFSYLLVYAFSIFFINQLLHSNYGFVMHKPERASLLNLLGDWPWYILWTLLIAFFIFFFLELPFKKNISSKK